MSNNLPPCGHRGRITDGEKCFCRLSNPAALVTFNACFTCIRRPSAGLGDTIAKAAHATGLDKAAKAVEKITGKPCGCDHRQKAMNKAVPYKTG